ATMNGYITPEGPIDLRVKGVLDLTYTRPALPMLRSGSGEVGLDLHFTGQSENPAIKGSIDLNGNSLMFRNFPLSMENLTGSFVFEGQKINMKDVKSRSDEGQMSFNGWIEHKNMRESAVDLSVSGNAMRFRNSENNLSLEFEGSLELKGKFPSPHLSGDISIIDGIYAKDFNILDQFIKDKSDNKKSYAQEVSYEINPSLDLRVKNSGDFEIKNNVGRIWLRFDAEVKGSLQKPVVSGAISASEGEIYYLGLLFDVDKGFVEFRGNYQEPYIEVHASKKVSIYNISLALYGNTDNLRLDLSATSPSGPLEKRDVVSLIMFGITEQEREMYARERSGDYTSSLLAKSLSSVVERPFTKYTRLDIFRLEAADPNSNSISRLYVGKQLSDRLGINFSTDIGTNESEQTIIAEYLLTDHLLLRGSQSTDNVSEISGLLRFRMR
nr:translocation/assembly module TamB domain-containing protein [bacterium]